MKKIIALIIGLLILELEGLMAAPFQPLNSLGVKQVEGKKLIEYKVMEHEGWYAVARKYGVTYKDLRAANREAGDTLHVGQVILVPGKPAATIHPELKKEAAKEASVKEPVYYVVKQKETLYAISKKYKVTPTELKKWNHLQSNSVKKGDKLIVGYKKETVKQEAAEKKTEQTAKRTVTEKESPVAKENEIKTDTAKKVAPDTLAPPKSFFGRKEVREQGVATWIDDENINPHKYFALHRNAAVGSIVKVTNRMNKRTVFVKVVGKLPDTGDNENVVIKISKASAEKLGVRDMRFQCELVYGAEK